MIPSHIQIGAAKVEVRECETIADDSGSYSRSHEPIIRIAKGLSPDAKFMAIFHEVLHACLDLHGASPGDDDTEERIVRVIEQSILAAFRDNPALYDLMKQWVKRNR